MIGHVREVEEHSDGGEEDSGEGVAKRKDVGKGLKPVLRFRDHEPREERAEGERKAEARGEERGSEAQEQDADGEELAVPEEHQTVEDAGNHEASARDQGRHHHQPDHEVLDRAVHVFDTRAGEDGNEEHEGNDAQVLEKEERHDDPAMRGVELCPIHVRLENDGGRRQRDERSVEKRLPQPDAERKYRRGDYGEREKDLEPASLDQLPPESQKPRERKLEPDGEKEEHHPELGDVRHRIRGRDETEPVRPGGDAGDEKPGDGRNAEAMRDRNDRDGNPDQRHQIPENSDVVHRTTIFDGYAVVVPSQGSTCASRSKSSWIMQTCP